MTHQKLFPLTNLPLMFPFSGHKKIKTREEFYRREAYFGAGREEEEF